MAKLVIFGTSHEIGELAHFYFSKDSEHEVVAFCVDKVYKTTDEFCGLPVVEFEEVEAKFAPSEYKMFVALGYTDMNRARAKKYAEAKSKGYELVSYISSKAFVADNAEIGENCFVMEDNTIQPFVKIGNNVTLWSGNHIGHDAVLEDNVFVTSHVVVSGATKVKRNSFLGVNATLSNEIEIGEYCLIGAGAVIMKSTKDKEVHVPARSIKLEKTSDDIKI